MLTRDFRRLSLFIGPLVFILYFWFSFYQDAANATTAVTPWNVSMPHDHGASQDVNYLEDDDAPGMGGNKSPESPPIALDSNDGQTMSDATDAPVDPLDELDGGSDSNTDEHTNHDESHALDSSKESKIEKEPPTTSSPDNMIQDPSAQAHDDSGVEHSNVKVDGHLDLGAGDTEGGEIPLKSPSQAHQELFSLSTFDRKFFYIDFPNEKTMNPNIIPHPTLDDTWVVVAQRVHIRGRRFVQLVCNAAFRDGVLRCIKAPTELPIAPTASGLCEGEWDYLNLNVGPHDPRVFMGPESPLVVYGSNSLITCFGQFVQDLRSLVNWDNQAPGSLDFRIGTELQRPPPWGALEKNWFLFWDTEGKPFVHYDVLPKRVFAQLNLDGSVGNDVSIFSTDQDARCMEKLMPRAENELESIHQATNSLKITLCKREDTDCTADEKNTFIFTIYQHKLFYNFHSVYEPYVMLFRQQAPFDIYALSKLPLWIHGREFRSDDKASDLFYITSMSWKKRGLKYHGYLDDEMFLTFGIEDERSGAIDIHASDLLEGLELCGDI